MGGAIRCGAARDADAPRAWPLSRSTRNLRRRRLARCLRFAVITTHSVNSVRSKELSMFSRTANRLAAGFVTGFFKSEEHTSELQSLMRISYAVFCLKKKNKLTTSSLHTTTQPILTINIHTYNKTHP